MIAELDNANAKNTSNSVEIDELKGELEKQRNKNNVNNYL